MARRPNTESTDDAIISDPWDALLKERAAHAASLTAMRHYFDLAARPMSNGVRLQSPCRICAPWSPQQRRAFGPCPCTTLPRHIAQELERVGTPITHFGPVDLGARVRSA